MGARDRRWDEMSITDREIERIADAVLRRIEEKQQTEELAEAMVKLLTEEQKAHIVRGLKTSTEQAPDSGCTGDEGVERAPQEPVASDEA